MLTAALAALLVSLAACGPGGGEETVATAKRGPGVGRPPVVLGAGDFTEQLVLGQLYTQALRAQGYHATLRPNIPSTELLHGALANGQIDGYAEYTGKLLTQVALITRRQSSAQAAYDTVRAFERRRGLTVLMRTPFSNVDALAVRASFAKQHQLVGVGDLAGLGSVKLGGPREFEARLTGLAGVKRSYGVPHVDFTALSIGQQYAALDRGRIQAADVFTTDPALRSGRYVVLEDPRHVFGFGHIVPIFNRQVIAAEGASFARIINAVSSKLTTRAVQRLNAAVDVDKHSPADAARTFLRSNPVR